MSDRYKTAPDFVRLLAEFVLNKRLYCVRSERNKMHVRVFVLNEKDLGSRTHTDIIEVTPMIARACNLRRTKSGFIAIRGSGHSPCLAVAEEVARVLKIPSIPVEDMG